MKKQLLTLFAASILFSGAAQAQELKVAAFSGNVPFEFQDLNSKWVGFEVDMMAEVGKALNRDVTYIPMPFNSIFSAVQSGRADIAIGSITITEKRMESVDFTQPYYNADQCLAVLSSGSIKGLADLKEQTVSAITGSTGEMWATGNSAEYGIKEVRKYDLMGDAMLDIAANRGIVGIVTDCPVVSYYIKDKPQYKIVATMPTYELYGMMFNKGNTLRDDVSAVITKLKESGEMAKIYQKWYGTEPAPESATVTVLPIPSLSE